MEKEKKILIKYVLYILVGLFIIIYGMFHKVPITFALTNQNTIQFYDNNGSGANWVTTSYISQIQKSEATFTTQAGSYGGLVLAMLPTPIAPNHNYSIFLSVGAESNGGFTELSSKNCIGLGNNYAQAIQSYVNCDYTPEYSRGSGNTGDYTRGIFWIFNSRQSAGYIALPYTTQYTCTNCLQYSYGMEINDNGDYTLLDETELNNVINAQSNSIDTTINNMQSSITNSITQGNNSILQNNNNNRDAIINNQNQTTQAIIDSNKSNFNTCRDSYNLYNYQSTTSVTSGVTVDNEGWITVTYNNTSGTANKYFNYWTNNLALSVNTNYKIITEIKNVSGSGSLFTMSNSGNSGQFQGSIGYNFGSLSNNVIKTETKTTKTSFTNVADGLRTYIQFQSGQSGSITFRISVIKNTDTFTEYEKYGVEICTNKLDEGEKTRKGILGKLTDFFNTMFSNDDADVSGLNNMVGWLPPGPVDSIINLPLSLFNSLMNTITGTCSPVVLNLPFVNKSLTLPCFNAFMGQYLTGFSTLWTLIGTILSVFILYRYLLSLYKWIDDTLTLRENNLPGYYDDNWGGGA